MANDIQPSGGGFPPHPKELPLRERISVWLPLLLCAAMAGGVWLGFELHKRTYANATIIQNSDGAVVGVAPELGKVEQILRLVGARYLENVDKSKLEDAAIVALLEELDPHSNYIPAEDLGEVNESLAGGFEGIGVEFYVLDDTVFVVGVIPDGPSDKAGLKVGDKILSIGDSSVAGIKIANKDVIAKLKGPENSEVAVSVLRGSEQKTYTIRRGQIPVNSVDISYMLDKETGYIKINRFSNKTYKEFMEGVEKMVEEEGMKNLVIDLRHNPGGYLSAATEILNQLFDTKKLLVYTEGRSYKRKEYMSDGKTFFNVQKIAVLIDEGSASASEILAGAIQDNDRGIVLGRRSFGKGLVQEQYDLSDNAALRLTVARYYTPSGRLIQKPYKKGDQIDEYDDDLKNRYESGELYSKDSIKLSDTTKYYTTGGRVVYGGGGIVPDVFVPLDTIMRNRYFGQVSGYISPFVYRYMDRNRASFAQYKDFQSFDKGFAISDALYNDFIRYTEQKGLPRQEAVLRQAQTEIRTYLKAYIGQQLFRDQGFFRVLHQNDKMLKRALQELYK